MGDGRWGKVNGMVEEVGMERDRKTEKTGRLTERDKGGRMRISITWSHSPERKETNKNRKHGLDRLH